VSSRPFQVNLVLTLLAILPIAASAQAGPPEPTSVVARYRAARLATMEGDASDASVEAVLRLLTDSAVYEHPQAGARIVGRVNVGAGIRRFLGATRRPRLTVVRQIVTGGAVASQERLEFEVRRDDGRWVRQARTQLAVYLVEGGLIAHELEYWVRR
jgi:SnoaL-like domain